MLALTLGLSLSHGGLASGTDKPNRSVVHPALLALMEKSPDQKVPVIVQRAPAATSQAIAKAAGGSVQEEFKFIHSFRMTVPAKTIENLSKNPNVRYISPDGPVDINAVDTSTLETLYPQLVGATSQWNSGTGLTGQGVTIAVIDSGVNTHPDFGNRIGLRWASRSGNNTDPNGHGTHVAGTITGRSADGKYIGVAPDARILSLKVADDKYQTSEASVVKALEWAYTNRNTYNIRIVNMSLSAHTATPYIYSPLAAAVEKLWQSGIVVVVAAGNRGWGPGVANYPPANDPFVITVGALDDNQTADPSDDTLAQFSSYGTTQNNIIKPDIVAPGRRIVAPSAGANALLVKNYPERVTADGQYIRLSGTSMAAPMVSGLVALMLEKYPELTPGQVKWALTTSAQAYSGQPVGTGGRVDIASALDLIAQRKAAGQPVPDANQGRLWSPQVPLLGSAATWEATDWSAAQYDQSYQQAAYWEAAYWEAAYWEAAYWEAAFGADFYNEASLLNETTAMEWD